MKMVNVYTLSHPKTNEIVYVGKTERTLNLRLHYHIKHSRAGIKNDWIQSLLLNGLKPKIELIDRVPDEIGDSEEIFYIAYFKSLGFTLLNLTHGGKGSLGLKASPELRKKLSASHVGTNLGHKVNPKSTAAVTASSAKRRRRVAKCDDEMNIIEIFESQTEAARITKFSKSKIGDAAKRENRNNLKYHGFYWKYI